MLACFFVLLSLRGRKKSITLKTQKKLSTRMRNTPKAKILGFCEKNDKSFCARWKLWPLKNIAAALNHFRKVFSKVMKNDDAIFFDLLCCTAQCGQDVFSFKKSDDINFIFLSNSSLSKIKWFEVEIQNLNISN